MSKDDGGPAFPLPAQIVHGLDDPSGEFPPGSGSANLLRQPGMSLRDYFAAAALQEAMRQTDAVMWNTRIEIKPEPRSNAARIAYEAADAMLAEREKS